MIYFKGDPIHGDIFYVISRDWGTTFSSPIRVNNEPEDAIAGGDHPGPTHCDWEKRSRPCSLEWIVQIFHPRALDA